MSDKMRWRLTRRNVVAGAAALASLSLLPRAARAAKAPKDALKYQDHPHEGQDCAGCIQFVPGKSATAMGECKVVDGSISPKGWCLAFVKKA